ncbi:tyrosine-type recombinase/integrase [Nocardioides montaniterrae]
MPRVLTPKQHEPIRLIETQSGPRYRVVIDIAPPGAKRKQCTKTFATLPEARRFVTETRDGLAKGTFTTPSKITLRALAEDWLQSRRDIRAKSIRGYADVLRPVMDRLGDRTAQSITRRDVDALVERLAANGGRDGSGYSHRTIVYTLGTLKQVLAYGVSTAVLSTNVATDVKAPRRRKGDRRTVVPWEPAELLAFRERADQDALAGAWRLTLCGLRRSEVLGLSWDDIDLDAGTVHIGWSRVAVGDGQTERDDTKSAAGDRTIRPDDVHPGTISLLRSLKAKQAADRLAVGPGYANDERLVVVNLVGQPLHPDVYSAQFTALCKAAGIRTIGIHTVRHTVARIMHEAGVSPADAAAFLGHTLAVHLAVYVVLTQRGALAAGAALGDALATVRA